MINNRIRRKAAGFLSVRVRQFSLYIPFSLCLTIALLWQTVRSQSSQDAPTRKPTPQGKVEKLTSVEVSPVQGASWLQHLGRPMNESSMGETGLLGPSPVQEQGAAQVDVSLPIGPLAITGKDLFELSCRGCHGERGEGAPPEINSMIDPVRATSIELIVERMKKVGAPVSTTVARQLASQAENLLLQRIHNGGHDMPAFPQFAPQEVKALVSYLHLLVGIPNAEKKQVTLEESVTHVGENLVKGTCHICHAAMGPNPSPEEIAGGAIPPLEILPKRVNLQQFVEKVIVGRPIYMGNLDLRYRGRMPVFYYLRPENVAAAYEYLKHYPPIGMAEK